MSGDSIRVFMSMIQMAGVEENVTCAVQGRMLLRLDVCRLVCGFY